MTVLLTGATGFVGGATLAHLLMGTDHRVELLVRAANQSEAWRRVEASLARFRVVADTRRVGVHPVALDGVERADLGAVTRVIHAASDTRFRSTPDQWRTNVDGAVALAHAARRLPRLERFLYVGTAWRCGCGVRGEVPEDWRGTAEHAVEYTRSKAAAEAALLAIPDLPLVVARPSIVVGHTRLGCAPSASIYWVFAAIDAMRTVSWPTDRRIDVVPVDWAAATLVHLLDAPRLAYQVYHLSSGVRSCDWDTLAGAFAKFRGERYAPYTQVDHPVSAWTDALLARVGADESRLRAALALYFRFAACDVIFSSHRVSAAGATVPPRFSEWLGVCAASVRGRGTQALAAADE